MNLLPVLNAGTTTGTGSMGVLGMVLYIGVIGLIFYFLLIRPQKKQQKKQEAMISTVAAGDSILTTSGFYGVVIDVMDDILIVEFGNNKNCRIPMKKSAVVEVEKPADE